MEVGVGGELKSKDLEWGRKGLVGGSGWGRRGWSWVRRGSSQGVGVGEVRGFGGLGSKELESEEFGSGGLGSGVGFERLEVGGVGIREVGIRGVGIERVGVRGVDDVSNFFDPNPPDPNSPDSNFPTPIPPNPTP